jgi:hypothetical protein
MNKCPDCGAANPSDEHLMREYTDLNKASFNKMFGQNAKRVQAEVARELKARGIHEIPNIFGAIPVRLCT